MPDERERRADARDLAADARDDRATERENTADERDRLADARERGASTGPGLGPDSLTRAGARDVAAEQRDRQAAVRDVAADDRGDGDPEDARHDRGFAADDRLRSGFDRGASADDRAVSAERAANGDEGREAALQDHVSSAIHRLLVQVDRHDARDNRQVARADREAAAREPSPTVE